MTKDLASSASPARPRRLTPWSGSAGGRSNLARRVARPVLAAAFVLACVAAMAAWRDSGAVFITGLLLLCTVGGMVAGIRTAWLAVPLALLLGGTVDEALDCDACRAGAEEPAFATQFMINGGLVALAGALAEGGAIAAISFGRAVPPLRRLLVRPIGTAARHAWLAPALLVAALVLVAVASLTRSDFERSRDGRLLVDRPDGADVFSGRSWGLGQGLTRAEFAAFSEFPVAWFGDEFAGLNASGALRSGDFLTVVYGSCRPAPCAAPLQINVNASQVVQDGYCPGDVINGQAVRPGFMAFRVEGVDVEVIWPPELAGVDDVLKALKFVDGRPFPADAGATCR